MAKRFSIESLSTGHDGKPIFDNRIHFFDPCDRKTLLCPTTQPDHFGVKYVRVPAKVVDGKCSKCGKLLSEEK